MTQHTLSTIAGLSGKGLHSGQPVSLIIRPAPADTGIVFIRADITDMDNRIPASYDHVEASQLCTLLKNKDGVSVSTVEHLMAAFAGLAIDNAIVELNGPEVPILDGSAMPFIDAIESVGIVSQDKPRKAFRIMKPVTVQDDQGRMASFIPDFSSIFEFTIDFDAPSIGRQSHVFELMEAEDFKDEIAECRTFTRLQDVEALYKAGLIKGGGLENAVVFDDNKIVNPEGLRHAFEPVRHKILDAIGDVYLAGRPIIGRFVCEKGGHALTNQLLRKVFATDGAIQSDTDFVGIGQRGEDRNTSSSSSKLVYSA